MQHQDGTMESDLGTMSEDKRRWLENVMQETFVDVVKQMQDIQEELKNIKFDSDKIQRAIELWEEMMEHVENLDYALAFCQIGGLPILFDYMQDTEKKVLEEGVNENTSTSNYEKCYGLVLSMIGVLTQNNPPVQAAVLSYPGLSIVPHLTQVILKLLKVSPCNNRLIAKALHALSCTVRNHQNKDVEDEFLERNQSVEEVFTEALTRGDERVKTKILFFLHALIGADHATVERAQKFLPILPLLAQALLHEDIGVRHAAATVVSEMCNVLGAELVMKDEVGGAELRRAMESRLQVIASLKGVEREEVEEEVHFWDTLQKKAIFLRDGEKEEEFLHRQGTRLLSSGEEKKEMEDTAPVLMIAPPELAGASKAP